MFLSAYEAVRNLYDFPIMSVFYVHDPATTPLSGDIYDGLWENGLKHGEGEIVYAHTGERSPGVWEFDDCMEEDTSALGCVLS